MQFLLDGKNIIGDNIFPQIAFNYLPPIIGIIFILGLILPFSQRRWCITALTSSFCIDIIGLKRKKSGLENKKKTLE
jgi:hypothetical protein